MPKRPKTTLAVWLAVIIVSAFAGEYLALSHPAAQTPVDVTGVWNATVTLGDQTGTPTLVLKQTGQKLSGRYATADGESPLEGTIQDDKVTFDCDISGVHVHFDGAVNSSGDEMEGTLDYAGQATAMLKASKK